MIKGFLNLPWLLWAALALIVAVVYSFVWPHRAVIATTSFLLRGLSPSFNGAANLIALAGGLNYAIFLVMTFVVK